MNFRVGSEGVRNRVAANYCQVTPAHSLFSEKTSQLILLAQGPVLAVARPAYTRISGYVANANGFST